MSVPSRQQALSNSRWVWVIRHAKAQNPAHTADIERPLAAQGQTDSLHVGRQLMEHRTTQIIYTSGALRAFTTAKILGEVTGAKVVGRTELYASTSEELLCTIQKIDKAIETAAIVAHNPGISELANLLDLHQRPIVLPPAGCIGFSYDGDWCDAHFDSFTRSIYFHP